MQVIGDILFGVGFFAVGCVVLFAFSVTVCDAVEHYIDGLFFFALCMLLSVMMVYKVSPVLDSNSWIHARPTDFFDTYLALSTGTRSLKRTSSLPSGTRALFGRSRSTST
jgi:hypothetical protein